MRGRAETGNEAIAGENS